MNQLITFQLEFPYTNSYFHLGPPPAPFVMPQLRRLELQECEPIFVSYIPLISFPVLEHLDWTLVGYRPSMNFMDALCTINAPQLYTIRACYVQLSVAYPSSLPEKGTLLALLLNRTAIPSSQFQKWTESFKVTNLDPSIFSLTFHGVEKPR